jgi:hypothetical protein
MLRQNFSKTKTLTNPGLKESIFKIKIGEGFERVTMMSPR